MPGISTALLEQWTDDLQDRPHWGTLFSADPYTVSEPATVELAGATFARQDGSGMFTRSSTTTLTVTTAVIFRGLEPGAVVAAVGFFDDAFASTLLLHRAMLPAPVDFPSGGTWVLPAGEYVTGFDL